MRDPGYRPSDIGRIGDSPRATTSASRAGGLFRSSSGRQGVLAVDDPELVAGFTRRSASQASTHAASEERGQYDTGTRPPGMLENLAYGLIPSTSGRTGHRGHPQSDAGQDGRSRDRWDRQRLDKTGATTYAGCRYSNAARGCCYEWRERKNSRRSWTSRSEASWVAWWPPRS
jgi:hypothetical protein